MERYSIFVDKKTQYFQDVCSQILYINAIPIKALENFIMDIDKLILSLYRESKDRKCPTQYCKEKQSWKTNVT